MPALTTIQLRRGTSTQWGASSSALAQGEFGYDITVKKYKIGDGTSLWGSLPWATILPAELLAGTGISITSGDGGYTIANTGITSTLAQISDVTATATEVNRLAGVTAGTVKSSGVVVADSSNNITGFNNVTASGTLTGTVLSITGSGNISSDLVVGGNLTVNGTTTTINSTTISVDDKNLELGSVASPTNTTADGAGITVKGTTDKTFNWVNSSSSWTSSEHLDLASGKVLKIAGTEVLSASNYSGKAATAGNADTVTTNANLTGPITSVGNATTIANGVISNVHIASTGAIAYSKLNLSGSIVNADVATGAAITYSKLSLGNSVVNADISNSAAIAYSKLNLASGVVNADISASAAIAYSKLNLATSIVNEDIATNAAIVDTKLATISTSGKVSNSATTATNANTVSAIVSRDASGNFSAGTITAALSGNASTATVLQTARTINGASFDGSANITISTVDGGTP